jgi:hypothetical protein
MEKRFAYIIMLIVIGAWLIPYAFNHISPYVAMLIIVATIYFLIKQISKISNEKN